MMHKLRTLNSAKNGSLRMFGRAWNPLGLLLPASGCRRGPGGGGGGGGGGG